MRPQSCGSPSSGTKSHLNVAPLEIYWIYYKGEGGGFPQAWAMVSFVSPSCPWFILTPEMLKLCTNHLVLVLCMFMWVVETCQFFLVPSRSSSMPLYPSKVLWTKEHAPIFYSSVVFNLDSHLSPSQRWERITHLAPTNLNASCRHLSWTLLWFHTFSQTFLWPSMFWHMRWANKAWFMVVAKNIFWNAMEMVTVNHRPYLFSISKIGIQRYVSQNILSLN
jgi:hypothetical protein